MSRSVDRAAIDRVLRGAAESTHFWIDRASGVCASIYSNSLPFITPEALQLYLDYEAARYAAL